MSKQAIEWECVSVLKQHKEIENTNDHKGNSNN